jgi:hypothetical protein
MHPHVLVEYDGPRLVLYRWGSIDRIGIPNDPESNPALWYLARTSKFELEALAGGDLPMRDIFSRKNQIRAIEIDATGRALRAWNMVPDDVDQGVLPAIGAPLPAASRTVLSRLLSISEDG